MKHDFSERLRAILTDRRISQRDLAELVNTTQATVSRWLSGDFAPRGPAAHHLAEKLGVDHDWLMGAGKSRDRINLFEGEASGRILEEGGSPESEDAMSRALKEIAHVVISKLPDAALVEYIALLAGHASLPLHEKLVTIHGLNSEIKTRLARKPKP